MLPERAGLVDGRVRGLGRRPGGCVVYQDGRFRRGKPTMSLPWLNGRHPGSWFEMKRALLVIDPRGLLGAVLSVVLNVVPNGEPNDDRYDCGRAYYCNNDAQDNATQQPVCAGFLALRVTRILFDLGFVILNPLELEQFVQLE